MSVRTLAAVVLFAAASVAAAEEVSLSKLERSIRKEPKYVSQAPRYALVAFGPKAKTRMWLVLDKSKEDRKAYDVLYADLNANGDLTEKGERFTDSVGDAARETSFNLPDFTDPATGGKHTQIELSVAPERPMHLLRLRWQGKHKLGGGYPVDPDKGYMAFGATAQEAPILCSTAMGRSASSAGSAATARSAKKAISVCSSALPGWAEARSALSRSTCCPRRKGSRPR